MDGNRALALIAIGGEATQVDHVVDRDDLTLVGAVVELVIVCVDRLHFGGVHQLQAHSTEESIAVDAGVAIAPESAAYHQVVQQCKAGGIGVRLGEDIAAGMIADRLPAIGGAVIEMHRKSPDRLGEDADTRPYCGQVQSTLLADEGTLRGIGNGVGE